MKIKVLIVEDDILAANALCAALENAGIDVVGTESQPLKAISTAKNKKPNVILMDVNFDHEIDGIDTAKMIQVFWSGVLIFVTGHNDTDLIDRAKELMPSGYIIKPFNSSSIISTVQIAFSNYQNNSDGVIESKEESSNFFFVLNKGAYKKIMKQTVVCIEALGSYVKIYGQGNEYLISSNLKNIEKQIWGRDFVRVSRKFIINKNYIKSIEGNSVYLDHFKESVTIGDKYRFKFLNELTFIKSK